MSLSGCRFDPRRPAVPLSAAPSPMVRLHSTALRLRNKKETTSQHLWQDCEGGGLSAKLVSALKRRGGLERSADSADSRHARDWTLVLFPEAGSHGKIAHGRCGRLSNVTRPVGRAQRCTWRRLLSAAASPVSWSRS